MQQLVLQPIALVPGLCHDDRPGILLAGGVLGRGSAGTRAEDQQLGEGIGAKPVRAVDAHTRNLARCVKPRDRRRAVDIGVDPTHRIVDHRSNGDQLLDRIDVLVLQAQLAHEGQLALDHLLAQVAQVEVDDGTVGRVDGAFQFHLFHKRL